MITRIPLMSCVEKRLEILELAILRMNVGVVGDVVAVVPQRRGIEGQEPDRGDPKVLQVVELLGQASKVAVAVPALSKKARTWAS